MKTSRQLDPTLQTAVIDSGPLFSALILHFDDVNGQFGRPGRFANKLDPFLRETANQASFMESMKSIRTKLVSSHVIGELQGLIKTRLGLKGDDMSDFWDSSIELPKQWNIDEQLVRLLDIASTEPLASIIPLIGPTDTGLIDLARQNACVLITDDASTLARESLEASGRVPACEAVGAGRSLAMRARYTN